MSYKIEKKERSSFFSKLTNIIFHFVFLYNESYIHVLKVTRFDTTGTVRGLPQVKTSIRRPRIELIITNSLMHKGEERTGKQ